VVVIGDAGHRSRHATGLLVDPALGVLPLLEDARIAEGDTGQREVQKVDSAIYRLAQRVAQDQEAAESDRLLYVAATRAKEMLLVSGVAGRGLDGWLKRLDVALAIADHLPSEGGDESPEVRSVTLDAAGQPVACTIYPAGAELPVQTAAVIAPSPVALPETPPLLRTFIPEPVAVDEAAREAALDPPRRVWRVVPEKARPTAPAWVVGRIAHGALEQWIFPDDAVRDFVTWAAAEARSCGITDRAEIQDAVQRAGSVLTRFRATGLFVQMDAAAQRFHEVPYSMIDGEGRLEHGVIDALFRDEMGWALVEFKTDHVEGPEALEELLTKEDYVPQVARYLAAVERRLGTRPRPVLCLLNYAGTVRLEENRWVWTSDKPHQSSQQEDMQ